MTGKGCQNHAIVKRFTAFCEHKKRLVKNCAIKKKDLLNSCLLKKVHQVWSKETKITAA